MVAMDTAGACDGHVIQRRLLCSGCHGDSDVTEPLDAVAVILNGPDWLLLFLIIYSLPLPNSFGFVLWEIWYLRMEVGEV